MNGQNDIAILNGEAELPNDGSRCAARRVVQHRRLAMPAWGAVRCSGIDGKTTLRRPRRKRWRKETGAWAEQRASSTICGFGTWCNDALRELVVQYREEGMVARRHEIRRIRQARLFWQGLQYAWWNPQDMTWNLPYESKMYDDSAAAEMPHYQFVTNLYQAFGLSFISVLSQDVPATRFYPQVGAVDR